MENIAAAIAKHGNIWTLQTKDDLEALYESLHAENSGNFTDIVASTKLLKYGPSERHRIDFYYPNLAPKDLLPVIVIFHGGGFTAGDNDITPFMHGHIGKYFASMGCVCALATYRLVPEAKYPSGAEDISLALKWAKDHAKDYGGDNTKITAIGQSAGGAHLASAVFSGKLKSVDVPLHGIVLLSAPLWYDLRQERRKANMAAYHNSSLDSDILEKTGVACFRNSNVDDVPSNMLLILGEFDPNEIVDGNFMLVEEYRKRFARIPSLEVLKGHNHISYFYGIGLGDDRLGKRVLEFIAQK